jgi:hypothetical protein
MSSSASLRPLWAGSLLAPWGEIPQTSWPATELVKHSVNKVIITAYIYKCEIWHQGFHFSDDLGLSTSIEWLQHDVEYSFFFRFLLYIYFITLLTAVIKGPLTSIGSSAATAAGVAARDAAGIATSWIFSRD